MIGAGPAIAGTACALCLFPGQAHPAGTSPEPGRVSPLPNGSCGRIVRRRHPAAKERNAMAGKHPDDSHSAPGTSSVSDVRLLAAQLFNETWRLMGLADRSQEDVSRMIGAAHASRFHWSQVPGHTPAHLARGDWLISRVYAELR